MAIVTREDYFSAAMEILASSGWSALKISALCSRFGVTVGSFYHHFGSYDAFVAALLEHWESEQTRRIIQLSSAPPCPLDRIRLLKKLALTLPHDAEAAIRAWAATDQQVRAVQLRVDAERIAAVENLIRGVVHDRSRTKRLALLGMSLLVGVQQLRSPVKRRELAHLLDEFERTVLQYADGDVARSAS